MALSSTTVSDLDILNKLKNDISKPIQYGVNCIDYRNNHYSRKMKKVMKNNSAHMRNKAELQKHDPNYKAPKGKFYKSRYNDFMMEFNKEKDKKGGAFTTLQAKKARILDKEEYENMMDAHKNPQAGHKPTTKLSKENRTIVNKKLLDNSNEYNKVEHPLCICKTDPEYIGKCTEQCTGSYIEQYHCIRCECPELYFGTNGLASKLAKHDRLEAK